MEGSPADRLTGMMFGFVPTQLVRVMARLRLADVLGDQEMTVDELAAAVEARPEMMARLVRALVGLGLLRLAEGDRVALTETGSLLASDHPQSMRSTALHHGGRMFRAFAELEHGIRTGEAPFEVAHGEPFFEHLRNDPEAGAEFDEMMTRFSRVVIREAVAACDFQSASRVLDVGGGRGHFVAEVLGAHPDLEGAVFDVPEAGPDAQRLIAESGLGDRCEAIGGSFFEAIPTGYDVHLLKWILHDWNDESCQKILESCRAALPEDGRLLIVERLLPDAVAADGGLPPAVAMDLVMLVNFADARERTLAEFDELVSGSGFAIQQVIELPRSGFSVLECTPTAT